MRIKRLFTVGLDGYVVLIVLTVPAAIAAILPYADIHRKTTYIVCLGIAILGTAAIVHHFRRLYRFDVARDLINELLIEGTEITLRVDDKVIQGRLEIEAWCKKVEAVLRKYLGEAYVTRFHMGGSNLQDATRMTAFKNNYRLETLATFLQELK